MTATPSAYSAFGLTIRSQIPLPELPPADLSPDEAADVEIFQGLVEADLPGSVEFEPGVRALRGRLLIDYPEGRYLIRDGREILVQPGAGVSPRDVRLYLLGSAMGAVFHQRGLLPLHANAIEIDERAVAFAGQSGAGKSTLAAHFNRLGYRVLSDDVCVISFDAQGLPLAWPGIPRIKLWSDALAVLGRAPDGLQPVMDRMDKYVLPMDGTEQPRSPLPLDAIYVLDAPETGEGIRRLSGGEAVDAMLANVYRWEFAAPLQVADRQFAAALSLLQHVEIYDAGRRWGYERFDAEMAKLQDHFSKRSGSY